MSDENTRYVMHVVYRDYSEQTKRFAMSPEKAHELAEKVLMSDNVRAVTLGEVLQYGHKSFTEDFMPERFMAV